MMEGRMSTRILDEIGANADDDAVRAFLLDVLYREAEGLRWWKDFYMRMIAEHCEVGERQDENRNDKD